MDQVTSSPVNRQQSNEPRFEALEASIKKEQEPRMDPLPFQAPSKPPSKSPIPTTESPDPAPMASKKKGTASIKKPGLKKRPAPSSLKKMVKKPRSADGSSKGSDGEQDDDGEEDEGPYCLCRGPDDHTWMIGCELCEDWFHGRCINMTKDIGDSLVERFICPNCTRGDRRTIFKKVCAYRSCRRAARLKEDPPSVFCSDEHAQSWWEKMVGRMPRSKQMAGELNDTLMQDEFMALIGSGVASVDEEGKWRLNRTPFVGDLPRDGKDGHDDLLLELLSEEEKQFLDNTAKTRSQLKEETELCHQMLSLVDYAQQRRRAAIAAGRFGNDSCGYDTRLDAVSAKDAFAIFIKSAEGEAILKNGKLSDPKGEDDEIRGMCEKKRCKAHRDWQKILPLGVKHRIREMAAREEEVEEEERIVRAAAGERWRRRKAENNWVEAVS